MNTPTNKELTEEEQIEISKKFHDWLETQMKSCPFDVTWFFQTIIGNSEMYSGNGCPLCNIERAVRWSEDVELKHASDEVIDTKVH